MTIKGNYDEAVSEELMVCGCDYPDPKDLENAEISLNWTIDETREVESLSLLLEAMKNNKCC